VRINKKRCKPAQKLEAGDEIRIPPFSGVTAAPPKKLGSGMRQLLEKSVLFENDEVLVINKPAGLAVHGGSNIRLGLIEALRQMNPQWPELELAHRLDRDTSGCILISKNTIFLRYIHRKFKEKSINKQYLALVHGKWPKGLLEVQAPLLKHGVSSNEHLVYIDDSGKSSLTRFRVIRRHQDSTLVEASPVSGRKHQIRAHCKHVGHPVVGDQKYVLKGLESPLRNVKTLCLHANKITFMMPGRNKSTEVEAPIDPTMASVLDKLNKK
jgi:23S rRNA pseudouridine955/2504/2580 synthase